mmetsp:Transcript_13654/g.23784  ORF Transcript_13654/g.23784 Transcript_13654/m.23784 type:complete len:100 (-) Transcript_13654:50-349(-)
MMQTSSRLGLSGVYISDLIADTWREREAGRAPDQVCVGDLSQRLGGSKAGSQPPQGPSGRQRLHDSCASSMESALLKVPCSFRRFVSGPEVRLSSVQPH